MLNLKMTTYKVMHKQNRKWEVYKTTEDRNEAQLIMQDLNLRTIGRLLRKFKKRKGISRRKVINIPEEVASRAYSRTYIVSEQGEPVQENLL